MRLDDAAAKAVFPALLTLLLLTGCEPSQPPVPQPDSMVEPVAEVAPKAVHLIRCLL